MSTPSPTVTHAPSRHAFETPDGAHLVYALQGTRAVFNHTYVPPALRGQGHAAALVSTALDHARRAGWQVVPACSYVRVFLQRNPTFAAGTLADGRPVVVSEG